MKLKPVNIFENQYEVPDQICCVLLRENSLQAEEMKFSVKTRG